MGLHQPSADTLEVDGTAPARPELYFAHQPMRVVEHRPMGFVALDILSRTELYLAPGQEPGRSLRGFDVYEALKDKPVMNANFLDALRRVLNAQDDEESEVTNLLVPPRLVRGDHGFYLYTFFWGTLYECPQGRRYVRFLCRVQHKPYFGYCGLDHLWRMNCPAALLP